jgi:hypothetical protein
MLSATITGLPTPLGVSMLLGTKPGKAPEVGVLVGRIAVVLVDEGREPTPASCCRGPAEVLEQPVPMGAPLMYTQFASATPAGLSPAMAIAQEASAPAVTRAPRLMSI